VNGFYLPTGSYYAVWNDIYYYPYDFELEPVLYKEAVILDTLYRDIGGLLSSYLPYKDYWERACMLLEKYPDNHLVSYLASKAAMNINDTDKWEN
jgi:hypothetical protein